MARFVLSSAVLACVLASVIASGWNQQEDAEGAELLSRERRQAGPAGPCGPHIFERVMGCCECPHLIPMEAFQNCSGNKQIMNKMGDKVRSAKNRIMAMMGGANGTNSTAGAVRENIFKNMKNMPGGPPCLFECVFKNQSYLTSSGNVNIDVVDTKFNAAASAAWKPIVQAALANCSALVANFDVSKFPALPAGMKMCKPGPAMFMGCMFRYTALNCPATLAKNGTGCAANLQKLKTCSMMPPMKPPTTTTVASG